MAMGINKTRHNNTAGGIDDCGISHLKIATHRRNLIVFYQNVQVCLVADQGVLRCDISIADNSLFHGTLLARIITIIYYVFLKTIIHYVILCNQLKTPMERYNEKSYHRP